MSAAILGGLIFSGASIGACVTNTLPTAGFWYENSAFDLPPDATSRIGGPLRQEDIETLKNISRIELDQAFSAFRITITQRHDAFWHVRVVGTMGEPGVLPTAGQSFHLGPFGGTGSVALVTLATSAIRYADVHSSRPDVIEGIGRGIGRAAAHELAHQILGSAMRDDRDDINSYEYFSSDRRSQYYGELRWNRVLSLLQQRLGT